jgi:Tfp pilus assembly protein FimT
MPRWRPAHGVTFIELLFVLLIVALVSAMAIPSLLAGLERTRAIAAARYLAAHCGVARFRAIGRARHVALRFTPVEGNDVAMQMFEDGNRDGVRTTDIAAAIDRRATPRTTLSADFRGVRIAIDPSLGLGTDPVRLSGSSLLSFTPAGTATAGTIYILGSDGTQLAVRVLGATGRTRVLRYERSTRTWEKP